MVQHLHRLGPRALGEFLVSVDCGGDVAIMLEQYQRLTPDMLVALGADAFPPLPLHGVP